MKLDLDIKRLGPAKIDSPLRALFAGEDQEINFVRDNQRVLFRPKVSADELVGGQGEVPMAELAGPRAKIYFDPQRTKAAVVTCGGLCPGINDVIRGIVMECHYRYGLTQVYGIKHGFRGFVQKDTGSVVELTPALVGRIHEHGGSILGTSRGEQDSERILDFLVEKDIGILFTIGGDGTLRGALELTQAAERRKRSISIIGIPKTVDNDILHIDRTFGFETAFSEATKSIISAHNEARGAPNGIGLVKLMGRHSGFIACYAALAMNDVNFVLIPEVPFALEGKGGFLKVLRRRIEERRHAVIVVAEGAGQELMEGQDLGRDASGNVRFKDIGLFLKDRINQYFASVPMEINVKYIDPSYIIRAIPASPLDNVYCLRLAQSAVHAALSGRTAMVVGMRHSFFIHLPMELVATGRRTVDPQGDLWQAVLSATGQPVSMKSQTESLPLD